MRAKRYRELQMRYVRDDLLSIDLGRVRRKKNAGLISQFEKVKRRLLARKKPT